MKFEIKAIDGKVFYVDKNNIKLSMLTIEEILYLILCKLTNSKKVIGDIKVK